MVCPFYGKNEDLCDVGCGYISPYDVRIISQFCSTQHEACQRYQYLMERLPEAACPASPPLDPPWPVSVPEQTPVLAFVATERETSPPSGPSPRINPPSPRPVVPAFRMETLSPWGLLIFGLTTLLFTLHQAGLAPFEPWFHQVGMLAGGLGQCIVGGLEWRKKHFFGATALTAYGLFWLSLLALLLLPEGGRGQMIVAPAVTAYLLLWCLFSAVLLVGTLQMHRSLQWTFGSATLLFFLLAASHAINTPLVATAAVCSGVCCGLVALYSGLAQGPCKTLPPREISGKTT